jgi:hypothetical protein
LTFASWQMSHFGPAAAAEISAPTADPDHDGMLNLFEYGCGTDPLVADSSSVPQVALEQIAESTFTARYLTFTFRRNPAAVDVTLAVQITSDLPYWSTDSEPLFLTFPELSRQRSPDGTETVKLRDFAPACLFQRRFVRLRVNQP